MLNNFINAKDRRAKGSLYSTSATAEKGSCFITLADCEVPMSIDIEASSRMIFGDNAIL